MDLNPAISAVIGRNVRTARTAAGFTQGGLARELGVESMRVSNWERGINRPNDDNLGRLSAILGQDVPWFFTDHKEPVA